MKILRAVRQFMYVLIVDEESNTYINVLRQGEPRSDKTTISGDACTSNICPSRKSHQRRGSGKYHDLQRSGGIAWLAVPLTVTSVVAVVKLTRKAAA
jgi:hypothetical protein